MEGTRQTSRPRASQRPTLKAVAREGAMGARAAPVRPPLMAGTGNWEQSKLEHPSVKPAPEPHLFIFRE